MMKLCTSRQPLLFFCFFRFFISASFIIVTYGAESIHLIQEWIICSYQNIFNFGQVVWSTHQPLNCLFVPKWTFFIPRITICRTKFHFICLYLLFSRSYTIPNLQSGFFLVQYGHLWQEHLDRLFNLYSAGKLKVIYTHFIHIYGSIKLFLLTVYLFDVC